MTAALACSTSRDRAFSTAMWGLDSTSSSSSSCTAVACALMSCSDGRDTAGDVGVSLRPPVDVVGSCSNCGTDAVLLDSSGTPGSPRLAGPVGSLVAGLSVEAGPASDAVPGGTSLLEHRERVQLRTDPVRMNQASCIWSMVVLVAMSHGRMQPGTHLCHPFA